jgi:hypothetical protein
MCAFTFSALGSEALVIHCIVVIVLGVVARFSRKEGGV